MALLQITSYCFIFWSHDMSWPPKLKCADMSFVFNRETLILQVLSFYSVKYFHFRYRHEVVYYDRKLFLFGGGTGLTAHALDKVRRHS